MKDFLDWWFGTPLVWYAVIPLTVLGGYLLEKRTERMEAEDREREAKGRDKPDS